MSNTMNQLLLENRRRPHIDLRRYLSFQSDETLVALKRRIDSRIETARWLYCGEIPDNFKVEIAGSMYKWSLACAAIAGVRRDRTFLKDKVVEEVIWQKDGF